MVLSVCREVLSDSHDADDAFQATFLALLRKSGSVRNVDSVASWLHGVAFRIGRRAKADAIRRIARERRMAEIRALRRDSETCRPEHLPELHEEIARLPLRFREPLVPCYLEGLTTDAAAQRLCCPQGTILSRLSRGRDRLRARLTRRGLAPAIRLENMTAPSEDRVVRVPRPLFVSAVQVGARAIGRPAPRALISASVASLTHGMLRTILWTKL
jgi:RNA polymerase sigma factor (sigma-70 family)